MGYLFKDKKDASARTCLKIAFRQMHVTMCGRLGPHGFTMFTLLKLWYNLDNKEQQTKDYLVVCENEGSPNEKVQ